MITLGSYFADFNKNLGISIVGDIPNGYNFI